MHQNPFDKDLLNDLKKLFEITQDRLTCSQQEYFKNRLDHYAEKEEMILIIFAQLGLNK